MATTASASKRSTRTADLPVVSGAPAHFRVGYIPAVDVDWIDALADKHRDAAVEYARAVEELGDLLDGGSEELVAHRRAVRTAIATGQSPPPPPDPAVIEARIAIANEDVEAAEAELCEVVTEVLGELRRRRAELVDLTPFPAPLLKNIVAGPGDVSGRAPIVAELSRRNLAAIRRTAGVDDIVPLNKPDVLEEVVG